jgi:hypothetical protein
MKSLNEQPSESIVLRNKGELMNPFELAKQLFNFAEKNLPESAGDRYSDLNGEYIDNPYVKELPTRFNQLIADYPGRYYVVSYENRTSTYYAPGSRTKYVRLSTVTKQSQSNDAVREVDITAPDVSEEKGNILVVSVKDSVMNKSTESINTAAPGEVNSPHGSAKFTYETNPVGDKKLVGLDFERMDEGMFLWHDVQTPVRWLRYLDIKNPDTKETKTQYRDMYIIGRHDQREDHKDTRIDVRFSVSGKLDEAESIVVSIGLDIGGKGEILFEDPEQKIKIVFHNVDPWITKEETLAILGQDPNYFFLLEPMVDRDKIIELLKNKTSMMIDDWNKPIAVFSQNGLNSNKPLTINR